MDKAKINDNKINTIKQNLVDVEREKIENVTELISLYVFQYVSTIKNNIIAFQINNIRYNFEDVINEELFAYFIKNDFKYYQLRRVNYNNIQEILSNAAVPQFQEIEKKVDGKHSFSQRLKFLADKKTGALNALKKQIVELENINKNIRNTTLQELYNPQIIDKKIYAAKQGKVIDILIRNGYIDENYFDYVSFFYEGSITKK